MLTSLLQFPWASATMYHQILILFNAGASSSGWGKVIFKAHHGVHLGSTKLYYYTDDKKVVVMVKTPSPSETLARTWAITQPTVLPAVMKNHSWLLERLQGELWLCENAVVQFYFLIQFWFIISRFINVKQRKIQIEPRIILNYNTKFK